MIERARKIKPLYLYILGAVIGSTGAFIKPNNEPVAIVVQLAGLAVIIFAIIKHLKS